MINYLSCRKALGLICIIRQKVTSRILTLSNSSLTLSGSQPFLLLIVYRVIPSLALGGVDCDMWRPLFVMVINRIAGILDYRSLVLFSVLLNNIHQAVYPTVQYRVWSYYLLLLKCWMLSRRCSVAHYLFRSMRGLISSLLLCCSHFDDSLQFVAASGLLTYRFNAYLWSHVSASFAFKYSVSSVDVCWWIFLLVWVL